MSERVPIDIGAEADRLRAVHAARAKEEAHDDREQNKHNDDVQPPAEEKWPDPMQEAALHGIAGEFVRWLDPHTEADPAAILMQLLEAFGALVGRGTPDKPGPYYQVESDFHFCNLFELLVGVTAKGRKGTSWGRVSKVFERIADWKPYLSGLSSGEGLKWNVRDPKEVKEETPIGTVTKTTDPGIGDKRLLVIEPEFASVLRATQRHGNTLSPTMREAWDTGNLRTLTKNDPITATGAHICVIGHITVDELRAELTGTDTANGFANRYLLAAVKRSKLLPHGGDDADDEEMNQFAQRLAVLAATARTRGRVTMTPPAREAWEIVYAPLSEGHDGLHGAVTARAEAQCIRLALLYALLDGAAQIDVAHLRAALAVWKYCDDTARYIFGTSLGDRIADEILRRLKQAGDAGMTRTDIRDVFARNQSAERIGAALELLQRRCQATCEMVSTGGRPTELWRAK